MKNSTASHSKCETYLIFRFETYLSDELRAISYFVFIVYCFIGLSAITDRFFLSMEKIVKHSRKVVVVDPETRVHTVRYEKVWNYAIADIALLAFGTSFPQISLATIDAVRNIGELYAGGLGPGTLVGSAAFDLFPIHAVCVIVPKAGELKKISDIGVWLVELLWSFWAYIWLYIILKVWTPDVITLWESLLTVLQYGLLLLHAYAQDKRIPYISLPFARSDRPLEWVPELPSSRTKLIEDFSDLSQGADLEVDDADWIHSGEVTGDAYHPLPVNEDYSSAESTRGRLCGKNVNFLSLWKEQFVDALMFRSHKLDNIIVRWIRAFWHLLLLPWRVLFAFVPPCHVAHGWIAFVSSLCFITGIAYVVTKLSDMISCVTGINPYVIAFTVLAAGTSWPDLWASKIAAERQITADSAIANITCSNSVNIYVGIGVPWLINTAYNFFAYREPLRIQDAGGLSFSLLVFFVTSACCIAVLVVRRLVFGAELGGPRVWAWATSGYFMLLWLVFVTLSSLKVSGFL